MLLPRLLPVMVLVLLVNLDYTNVDISIKFSCEFKLAPDYSTTESFKLNVRKFFKFLQQQKVVTP